MKRSMRLLSMVLAIAMLLCATLPIAAEAAWTQKPEFSLSASLSADRKTVTLTLSTTACDPVCALQTELVYDFYNLTAVDKPVLASPWSGMLAASNVPVSGTAVIAAAAASGIVNSGGTVATMRFSVADDADVSTYFYIRDALIASTDDSKYDASFFSYITLDLSEASSGISSAPGPVPSSLLTPAERLKDTVILQDGNYAAVIDGKLTHVDAENTAVMPYINTDNRTMVPVRFVAEALGAIVGWDNASRQVTITYNDNITVLTIDSATYTINGETKVMDTAPVINEGLDRTMVPVRFIMEALGLSVAWDNTNRLVIIAPATAPWDLDGSTEAQATILVLYLISDQMRDFT